MKEGGLPLRSNLLTYTAEYIGMLRKKTNEVSWVASRDGTYAIGWKEFEVIAANTWFREGKEGNRDVAHDLVMVFTDATWMEWQTGVNPTGGPGWVYYRIPTKKRKSWKFKALCVADMFSGRK